MSPRFVPAGRLVAAALGVALCGLAGCGGKDTRTGPTLIEPLQSAVIRVRATHGLPALGVARVVADTIEVAVSGVRRLGAPAPVQPGDRWHLGSIAKSMTATLVARHVEAGDLAWDLTLAAAFPELAPEMHDDYRDVTLAELLHHRGGVPAFETWEDFDGLPPFAGDDVAQRRAFVEWLVTRPPANARGAYRYSNAGYGVAAAMLEGATGESWESLIEAELFAPLGMTATFGWPTDGDPNQPWGHVEEGGVLAPFDPSSGRVPVVVAPAGDLSTSLADAAKFARLHLKAMRGDPDLLASASFDSLHTPIGGYGMGWQTIQYSRKTLWVHEGSAGTFAAVIVIDPVGGTAGVIATNALAASVERAFIDLLRAAAPSLGAVPLEGLSRSSRVPVRLGGGR